MAARSLVPWLVALAACGARPHPPPPKAERVAIIASERGPHGARLVAIDENGDRRHVVIAEARGVVRDTNPTVSPDGRWVVFASSRDRTLSETSLWIAPIGVEVTPVRLTTGSAIESHPTWTRDGEAIVFASTREGGDFDLWRLAIANGRVQGEPVQLTNAPGHEVTPTVAADGAIIYSSVTPMPDDAVQAHLEERAPNGTIKKLTEGPADTTPALSPDETTIAYSRVGGFDRALDVELWLMRRADGSVRKLIELPPTDESGPVWSRDGAYVFATSALRPDALSGEVKFSSVIHVQIAETPPRARILTDHAGGIPRLTPAIVAPSLDAKALRTDPEYLPELARIMSVIIEHAKRQGGQ